MADESRRGRYSPDRKGLMLKYGSIAATGIIAGGSMFSLGACSKREQWAETSGKAGQINLEDVENAMKDSSDVSEFEQKVNEIYTGEEMVLIEVTNQGTEQLVSGYADLDNNLEINHDSDDKLFTFRRWFEGDKPRYSMRGYGVNSYYYRPYPMSNMLGTYLLVSALTRPMYSRPIYHTTVVQRQATRQYRTNYRKTPSYRSQVSKNRSFQTKMSTKHGTTYKKASPSTSRNKWATSKGVNLNKATKSSKSFTRSSRSSWGSRSSSRSSSRGFRGGTAGGGIGLLCRAKFQG